MLALQSTTTFLTSKPQMGVVIQTIANQESSWKKTHASGRIVLSDSESVARFGDKLIVKPKFVVDYIQHLEVMEFKKRNDWKKGQGKLGRQEKSRMKVIIGFIWAKMPQSLKSSVC